MRSERSLLVLAVFDRLRGLDDVGFGMALALAGLGLARRVLGLADEYITKLRMKYQSDVISLYLIFRSPVFPRCFPGVSPLLIIIMKSKSVGCHFISMHVFISVNYYYYLIIIILL